MDSFASKTDTLLRPGKNTIFSDQIVVYQTPYRAFPSRPYEHSSLGHKNLYIMCGLGGHSKKRNMYDGKDPEPVALQDRLFFGGVHIVYTHLLRESLSAMKLR
jgi:hypothetical protein